MRKMLWQAARDATCLDGSFLTTPLAFPNAFQRLTSGSRQVRALESHLVYPGLQLSLPLSLGISPSGSSACGLSDHHPSLSMPFPQLMKGA